MQLAAQLHLEAGDLLIISGGSWEQVSLPMFMSIVLH